MLKCHHALPNEIEIDLWMSGKVGIYRFLRGIFQKVVETLETSIL